MRQYELFGDTIQIGCPKMKILRQLPDNRSYDSLLRHYKLEKQIASALKQGDREERKKLYHTMYDELFEQVRDHPRLTKRDTHRKLDSDQMLKLNLIKKLLNSSSEYVEFGSGDCRVAFEVCRWCKKVTCIDISDQRDVKLRSPANLTFRVYDGFSLEVGKDETDLVFSNQLIEHLHPDDTQSHFFLVKQILKSGGAYLFATPHQYLGPHDVSKYFSNEAMGFHLKEWTYETLLSLMSGLGFSSVQCFYPFKGRYFKIPSPFFILVEKLLKKFPYTLRRFFAGLFTKEIVIAVIK